MEVEQRIPDQQNPRLNRTVGGNGVIEWLKRKGLPKLRRGLKDASALILIALLIFFGGIGVLIRVFVDWLDERIERLER